MRRQAARRATSALRGGRNSKRPSAARMRANFGRGAPSRAVQPPSRSFPRLRLGHFDLPSRGRLLVVRGRGGEGASRTPHPTPREARGRLLPQRWYRCRWRPGRCGPRARGPLDLPEDWRLVRKDGGRIWARVSGQALDAAAPESGIVWMVEDVTIAGWSSGRRRGARASCRACTASRPIADSRSPRPGTTRRRAGSSSAPMMKVVTPIHIISLVSTSGMK